MKKKTMTIIAAVLMSVVLAGCSGANTGHGTRQNGEEASGQTGEVKESESDRITENPANAEQNVIKETVPGESSKGDGTVMLNGGTEIALSSLAYQTDSDDVPEVFFISDITSEALVKAYEALDWVPEGKVAVKLSTGEPPASNYLSPELIRQLVGIVEGTIVECNTAYGGSRASTAAHYQVAKDHGFTDIAEVQILDENGSMTLPVEGGTMLTENYVGAAFGDYDSYLVLSHFKGHAMAGYGGAIKNISIGLGSSDGKAHIHTGGTGGFGSSFTYDTGIALCG